MSSNTSQGNPDAVDPAIWRMAFTMVVGAMAVIFDMTIVSDALNDLNREPTWPIGTCPPTGRTRLACCWSHPGWPPWSMACPRSEGTVGSSAPGSWFR